MKRSLFTLLLAFVVLSVGRAETTMSIVGYDVIHDDFCGPHFDEVFDEEKDYSTTIPFFQIGFEYFANTAYSSYPSGTEPFVDNKIGPSTHIALNFFKFGTSFDKKGRFGLSLGVGLGWDNMVLGDSRITLTDATGMIMPTVVEMKGCDQSKITNFFFWLPASIDFNKRYFHFSVGGYGKAILRSYVRTHGPSNGPTNIDYVNTLQAGLLARAGYRDVFIFANYALTPYFEKGKGPETNLLTFGFGLWL